jgi:CBS domain-containing protein
MHTVKDILERKGYKVVVISPDASVLEATRLMNSERIGALIVHTDGDGVLGIFTERDLLRRVVAEGKDPAQTIVKDVMSSPVACCKLTTLLSECQSVMTEKRLRHLPVLEGERLVGVVSSGDLMVQEIEVQQSTIEYFHHYLHGRM